LEIDALANCDYSDYMTATLRETKAKLSEMVRLASQGEEVIITVHGKQMAKLVGLPSQTKKLDKKKWLAELARLRRKYSTGRVTMTAQEIQDEIRADRI
jgi:prevent-host-death family protein